MRRLSLLFCLWLFFLCLIGTQIIAAAECDTVNSAKASVVLDVKSGRILYGNNIHAKMPMASTTKIMTTLVAIESGRLHEMAKVSPKAASVGGSSIYLRPGEQMSVEDLLYGVMLQSGNDAAMTVAEHIGGSVEGFAALMNKKALEIGAVNTHFDNPHGLDSASHYTTAYDLALITSYALKNKKFAEIVRTKRKTIQGPPDENWDRIINNKNKMLYQFNGGDGVKTGYTKGAGRCLVSSATRGNWQLVCVVLNCGPMWQVSSSLLETCFGKYQSCKLVSKESGPSYEDILVKSGKKLFTTAKPRYDFIIPLTKEEKDQIRIVPSVIKPVVAPIQNGGYAGSLQIFIGNKHIGQVPLEYCEEIKSNNPIYYINKLVKNHQ